MAQSPLKKVVIFGGSGDQGGSVVKALCESGQYDVSVLTRDLAKPSSIKLKETYNVTLIQGSYTSEEGLRSAFRGQDVCFFSLDSFSIGEPEEYFWTFRAYEIAVQEGLKWFIYSGSVDRFGKYGYDERYRNSHNIVSSRITGWLSAQPLGRLPWTIVHGGVYVQMLSRLLQPMLNDDGTVTFRAPMTDESVIPLVPLDMYGKRVLWALQNPVGSVGRLLTCAPFHVTYPEIAQALQDVTNVPTSFQEISVDTWMQDITRLGKNPDTILPRGSTGDNPARFTFRKSFEAWWALWRDNKGQLRDEVQSESWADEIYPERAKTLAEWMRKSGYSDTLGLSHS